MKPVALFTFLVVASFLSSCREQGASVVTESAADGSSIVSATQINQAREDQRIKDQNEMIDKREQRANGLVLEQLKEDGETKRTIIRAEQEAKNQFENQASQVEAERVRQKGRTNQVTMEQVGGILSAVGPAYIESSSNRKTADKNRKAQEEESDKNRTHQEKMLEMNLASQESIAESKNAEKRTLDQFAQSTPVYEKNKKDFENYQKLRSSDLYKRLADAQKKVDEATNKVGLSDNAQAELIKGATERMKAVEGEIKALKDGNAIAEAYEAHLKKDDDGNIVISGQHAEVNPEFEAIHQRAQALYEGSQRELNKAHRELNKGYIDGLATMGDVVSGKLPTLPPVAGTSPGSASGVAAPITGDHVNEPTPVESDHQIICVDTEMSDCGHAQEEVNNLFSAIVSFASEEDRSERKTSVLQTRIEELMADRFSGKQFSEGVLKTRADNLRELLNHALAQAQSDPEAIKSQAKNFDGLKAFADHFKHQNATRVTVSGVSGAFSSSSNTMVAIKGGYEGIWPSSTAGVNLGPATCNFTDEHC